MRKTYMFFLTLALTVLGVMTASAEKADLDPAMFKAWDGYLPGANVVAEPDPCPNSDGTTSPFNCDYKLYETVAAGTCVYGNTNVYYLWYADLTGTNTMTIEATPGMQFRVLFNRPAADGDDPHGGTTTELTATIGEDGKAVFDLSSYEYIHLNAIKTGWGSASGTISKIELDGTVKAVTGWVDMINNGNMEGDDTSSFVQALNAVEVEGYQPCTITDGVGKDGSRGIMVESMDSPAQSWATQFFLKFNEFLPQDTKWRISFDYRANREVETGTGCHGEPRSWHSGGLFEGLHFSTEWQSFSAEGTVTAEQAGSDGLGSIAFDLNNDPSATQYFFDNFVFQVYRESTPISLIKTAYGADVVCVDFGKPTNMKDLVKEAGGLRVVYPNDCATVMVNGQPTTLLSVEGRPDGKLYIFIDEGYPEGDGEDMVAVSFNNPTDAKMQIIFTDGKYKGEAVPNFTNILADYNFELSENYSYLYGVPVIVSADPEDGSFNLPVNMTEFKVTFDHSVACASLKATFDKEAMTVTPAEGSAKEITLTRTSTGDIAAGQHTITISNVTGEKDLGETGEYSLNLSFGPLVIDPNDQPEEIIPLSYMNETESNQIPVGFQLTFDDGAEVRYHGEAGEPYGSGPRTFTFPAGGDFTKGLYTRNGYITFGELEEYPLELKAGKKYTVSFNTARWKASGQYFKFEVLDEFEMALVSQVVENNPDVNGNTSAAVANSNAYEFSFTPESIGRYILKWTVCDASGNAITGGYTEPLLANVLLRYIPSTIGVEETTLLNTALANAKNVRDGNSEERYSGAAWTALDNKIKEYDGKTLTAPSAFRKAAAELDAAAKFMQDHRLLCDTYDPLPKQAFDLYEANKEKKFNTTELFVLLKGTVMKYCTIGTEEVVNEETGETMTQEVMASFKVLYDDADLTASVEELSEIINMSSKSFTEGKSENVWGKLTTGYAALHERLRRGVELLKSIGIADDAKEIVRAESILGDSDSAAENMVRLAKSTILSDLASGETQLFAISDVDEEGNAISKSYDLSVFVKNPNIYGPAFSTEAPGWTGAKGNVFAWSSWDGAANHTTSTPYPEDCKIHAGWHPNGGAIVQQTIEGLPAGIYTVKFRCGDNGGPAPGTYAFVKTSATPVPDTDDILTDEEQIAVYTAGFITHDGECENIEVNDGVMTVGYSFGPESQAFLDDVEIWMTSPLDGHNYKLDYDAFIAGIEEHVAKAADIRSIELFDLNGRRISTARKGIVLVKKHMSDGTVVTEKVVKK